MIEKECPTCRYDGTINNNCTPCDSDFSGWELESKTISFPICNNLTPNLHSCTLKVIEEFGELMEKLGKGQGANREKHYISLIKKRTWAVETIKESIDTAQSAITLAYILAEENGISMDVIMTEHTEKLRERGYLK